MCGSFADWVGELVTREELISSCWDDRIVGDDVINRAILILRRVAKASRIDPEFKMSFLGYHVESPRRTMSAPPSIKIV